MWIWIDDPVIDEDRSDYYPVLRQWMEGFIGEHPYILHDDDRDPRSQFPIQQHQGPKVSVKGKLYTQVLLGCSDLQVLRGHQEEYGLSWLGGLGIYIFDRLEDVEAQLGAWAGQNEEALASFLKPPLFSVMTGGDAHGLFVTPGEWCAEEILEKASAIAAELGFDWGPLERSVLNAGSERTARWAEMFWRALRDWFVSHLWKRGE